MVSRDRIKAAFSFQNSDKIPLDLGGHRSSGIAVQAYRKLREYLGLPESKLYVYDFIQQLAIIEDDVLDIFGTDVVQLGYDYYKRPGYWKDWELPDGTPCKIPAFIDVEKTGDGNVVRSNDGEVICIQKPHALYYEQTCFPLHKDHEPKPRSLDEVLEKIMWCKIGVPPTQGGFDEQSLKVQAEDAKNLRMSTTRAIYAIFGGSLVEISQFAHRMDYFLYMIAAEPERVHRFLDELLQHHLENLTKFLGAVGPYVDVIGFSDDMGLQTGLQFSGKMYREFFKPRHKVLWQTAKKLCPHIKTCLHCCGDIHEILPDLIEIGLDAMNPVQISCPGMDPVRLKQIFGKNMVFWGGGCDTQSVLPYGTPETIKEHVKHQIDVLGQNGGFVFQQVHNIMADVPPQNIAAMLEAVKEYQSAG